MTLKNRLQLLSEAEIEELYARPDFNEAERELYFTMNQQEMDALRQYSATKTRVAFILQLGYFKASQQIFAFTFDEVRYDVDYIRLRCKKEPILKILSFGGISTVQAKLFINE
ncbi:TPA: DUF4158 domain-containing protein [Legionella pneumophila]|nr:DUF4158 domain-containing protein [Legionella pneumophila]